MSTAVTFAYKNVDSPDQRRAMDHGRLDVVDLPGVSVTRALFQPGWRWSTDVAPGAGTPSCGVTHTGYVVSGRFHVRMDDGREYEFGPGDAHVIGPGHDAWVVGDETCVVIDFTSTPGAAVGLVGRCPCGVEFRIASDRELDHLVAAVREHASASHGHELSVDEVMAEVTAA